MTFAQAAEAHLDDVYGYLAWFTGDRVAADDLAGETFERALRLWHRFDPEARLGPHLALPGRADGRARPLPLRAPAHAARAARRRSPSGSTSGSSKGSRPTSRPRCAR